MANGWIDGLVWLPGRQAGGAFGRVDRRYSVRHETVGTNSRQIGMNGFFNFRYPKEGPAEQYGEWWTLAWHACSEHNPFSEGHEVERFPGEPMTENQARWIAYTLSHIAAEAGALPTDWFEGPPRVESGRFSGYVNHRDLVIRQCDPHGDGWTYEEWQWIRALMGAPQQEEDVKGTFIKNQSEPWVWFFVDGYRTPTKNRTHMELLQFFGQSSNGPDNVAVLSDAQLASIPVWNPESAPPASGASTGGASAVQVSQIVAASEQRVIAAVNEPRELVGQVR